MNTTSTRARRIVLATFGSLGDLHPFLALGTELQARGYNVVIATSSMYREKIEELGLDFARVRPELPKTEDQAAVMRRAMDLRGGSDYLFRKLLLPHLTASRDDLRAAVAGADALVFHPIVLAAFSVAQERNLPRIATLLQPMMMLSAHDPPVIAGLESLEFLRVLAPGMQKILLRWGTQTYVRKLQPVRRMRHAMNLPTAPRPFFDDACQADATLALFSRVLAPPQKDWPRNTTLCGFCFHDSRGALSSGEATANSGDERGGLSRELQEFLHSGEPPIVFTLGSAAVLDAGNFFIESARAAAMLKKRAVLLLGPERNVPRDLPRGVATFDYAPFSTLFPHAAAVVHQGGVGTTGQVMRAGVPSVVVPFSHDQPDNAARLRRLGIARIVPRKSYRAENIVRELSTVLESRGYSQRAAQIGEKVRRENGVQEACDAIERVLQSKQKSHD